MRRLPAFPFVVLDMNTCRDPEVLRRVHQAHDRDGLHVMLPVMAHYEMTKGAPWTLARSLGGLAARPEAFSVAQHGFLLRAEERRTKRGLRISQITDHRNTRNVRDVMRGLRDDTHDVDPTTIANVRDFFRRILDHEDEPHVMRELVKIHRRELPQVRANALRASLQQDPPDRRPFQGYLYEALGSHVHLAKFLRNVGQGSSRGKHLVKFPSFSLLHLIGLHAVALRWRIFGGIETAPAEILENDVIDVEYAVLAAYGRDYITGDRRARAVYEDVRAVASRLWP